MDYQTLINHLKQNCPDCTITYYAEEADFSNAEQKNFEGMPEKLANSFKLAHDIAQDWDNLSPQEKDESLHLLSNGYLRFMPIKGYRGNRPLFIIIP